MKKITNWQKATVVDIEADGLLEGATKIHVLSYKLTGKGVKSIGKKNQSERVKKFFKYHINQQIPVVMHNGISYDAPLVEKILGIDLSELMVIDTLGLSWHLNPNRSSHGLDSFFPDYGIEKPKVSDWQNLSFDEYRHRCEQDVLINTALWEDLSSRLLDMYCLAKTEIDEGLVGGKRAHAEEVQYIDSLRGLDVKDHVDRLMTFVMFKMDCARLQEKTRWKVDEDLLDDSLKKLNGLLEEAQVNLEAVMPEIPQYSNRKKPAKPYKQNGELSASGQSWQELQEAVREGTTDEKGNPIAVVKDENNIKKLKGYNPPNINSSQQLKDFLFSRGWEPETFKYDRDQEAFDKWIKSKPPEGSPRSAWTSWKNSRPQDRKIPQLSVDGKNGKELCSSVVRLAEDVPEIMYYNEYTTIKHRRDLLKGFKESMSPDGYLQARVGGFTNTFRVKHRGIVNLPGVDKPYGEEVRGCLIAEEGYTSLGSDLSSLEDRVKMHFMIPHDPEYVETMNSSDFDPHLKMAVVAGFITEQEMEDHKGGNETKESKEARKLGKSCLPVDTTEVLTSVGWKKYGDIHVGDQVMSLNTETGLTEFTEVENTVFYASRSTTVLSNHNLKLESTSDHRWIVGGSRYKTTEQLHKGDNLTTTATYAGGSSGITRSEAEVLGWVLSDGYIQCSRLTGRTSQGADGRRQSVKMSLSQHPKKYLEEMRRSVEEAGLPCNEHVQANGVHVLTIPQPEARDLLKRMGLPLVNKRDMDFTELLLGMSQDALEGFVHAFWLGDGWTAKTRYTNVLSFFQKSGGTDDAIRLACYLLGKDVTVGGVRSFSARDRQHITMQNTKKLEGRVVDVFCLTTGNGNFVIRQNGKITITGNCNYAAVYNSGAKTLARTAKIDEGTAQKLLDGYWKLNWSVKAIAEEQKVITCEKDMKWLINPVNGFCYSLRKESDRFSTLCQGTGSFFFDMWVDSVLEIMQERYNTKRLTGSFHDEVILTLKDKERTRLAAEQMVHDALEEVNQKYLIRKPLGCDVQFGKSYAEIH